MSSATLARAGSLALLALLFCRSSLAAQTGDISPSEAEARAFASTGPAEELRWATIAAEGGQRDAQVLLGNRYLRGTNVPKDEERGIEWLRRAANEGSAPAQSLLGWIYSGGIQARQDPAAALKWFTAAARQEGEAIVAAQPTHIFGLYLVGRAAELEGDTEDAEAFYGRLLANFDAELASEKLEYAEHQEISRMRTEAEAFLSR